MPNSNEPALIISPARAEHDAPARRGSAQNNPAPKEPQAKRRSPRSLPQAEPWTPATAVTDALAGPGTTADSRSPATAVNYALLSPIRQAGPDTPETVIKSTLVDPEATASRPTPETVNLLPPSPPDSIWLCAELVALQKRRRFAIKMQSRIDRGLQSILAGQLGYHTRLPPADRLRLFRRAAVIRAAVINDDQLAGLTDEELRIANIWRSVIITTEQSRGGWDLLRADVERSMETLAIQLPVWRWASIVRGFSPLGLAAIVGESCGVNATTPAAYSSHQNLSKRLGLGVVDGVRQGAPGANATAEDWIRHGYKRDRRAEIWTFLDLGIRNAQYRREGPPLGAYGALYAKQVAVYEERGWKHARPAAGRYMAKCFIRDLWRAWRHVEGFAGEAVGTASPQDQASGAAPGETP